MYDYIEILVVFNLKFKLLSTQDFKVIATINHLKLTNFKEGHFYLHIKLQHLISAYNQKNAYNVELESDLLYLA